MPEINLKVIPNDTPVAQKVSLKPEVKPAPKEYVAEKKDVSENIKSFEERVARIKSAASYNAISLKPKANNVPITPTAFQMITSPVHNTIGKFLGVDTVHDWDRYYDKVGVIVDWAKQNTGTEDVGRIVDFISGAANFAPTFDMNQKKIDQIYLMARLHPATKQNNYG